MIQNLQQSQNESIKNSQHSHRPGSPRDPRPAQACLTNQARPGQSTRTSFNLCFNYLLTKQNSIHANEINKFLASSNNFTREKKCFNNQYSKNGNFMNQNNNNYLFLKNQDTQALLCIFKYQTQSVGQFHEDGQQFHEDGQRSLLSLALPSHGNKNIMCNTNIAS